MYKIQKPIIVCGVPCSGKTTISNEISKYVENSFIIDKDDINQAFCSDHESEHYKKHVRHQSYKAALLLAKRNLVLGKTPILDIPYVKEIVSGYFDKELIPLLGEPKIILCYIEEQKLKQRIIERNAERDMKKLANWNEFLEEEPIIPKEIEKYNHIKIDTSKSLEENIKEILDYLK